MFRKFTYNSLIISRMRASHFLLLVVVFFSSLSATCRNIHYSAEDLVSSSVEIKDFTEVVIIDLGRTLLKGEEYSVEWSKHQINSLNASSTIQIRESNSKTNFILNSKKGVSNTNKSQILTLKAQRETRYISIQLYSPVDDALIIEGFHINTNNKEEKTANPPVKKTVEKSAPRQRHSKEKITDNTENIKDLKEERTSVGSYKTINSLEIGQLFNSVLFKKEEYPVLAIRNPNTANELIDLMPHCTAENNTNQEQFLTDVIILEVRPPPE